MRRQMWQMHSHKWGRRSPVQVRRVSATSHGRGPRVSEWERRTLQVEGPGEAAGHAVADEVAGEPQAQPLAEPHILRPVHTPSAALRPLDLIRPQPRHRRSPLLPNPLSCGRYCTALLVPPPRRETGTEVASQLDVLQRILDKQRTEESMRTLATLQRADAQARPSGARRHLPKSPTRLARPCRHPDVPHLVHVTLEGFDG